MDTFDGGLSGGTGDRGLGLGCTRHPAAPAPPPDDPQPSSLVDLLRQLDTAALDRMFQNG